MTITPPPINADTLDGKHAVDFAAALHDHDSLYQKKYANVVIVAKSGGDFIDPVAAINSILDASATNPYLIKIMPGVYDLGTSTLFMKEYVDIEGAGQNVTVIKKLGSGVYTNTGAVNGASNSEIRSLTISNIGGTGGFAFLGIGGISAVLSNITAIASGGIDANVAVMIQDGSSVVLSNVTATASGGTQSTAIGLSTGINASCVLSNITATASGASDFNTAISAGGATTAFLSNVTATASGGGSYGIYICDSFLTMTDVTVTSSYIGLQTLYSGTTTIDRSTFKGTMSIANASSHTLKIGASKLIGDVSDGGTTTCVASYNGNYASLDASCH